MVIDLLSQLTLFQGIPAGELEALLELAETHVFPDGEVIFRENDPAGEFSIIIAGSIEVIRSLGTPEERMLGVVGVGDFLGEMSLLDPDQKRTASARTLSATTLIGISKDTFEALLQRQPGFGIRLMREMNHRIRRWESITILDLQEKNRRLNQTLIELEAAQAQLIEKERLETELALARSIQEGSLIKELPACPGWTLAAAWLPARSVSGDFYDFNLVSPEKLQFLIADVSGKGMPAALVVATSRSILRTLMARGESPEQIFTVASDVLFEETPVGMFVTCFFGALDLNTGLLQFANAGHSYPTLLTDQGIIDLKAVGRPLGMLPGSHYEQKELILQPGDQLLLYSDGLLEAHSPAGDMFGRDRIVRSLQASFLADRSAQQRIAQMLEDLQSFTGNTLEQEDDVTCVVVGRNLPGSSPA